MKQIEPPHKSARSIWQSMGEITLPVDQVGRESMSAQLQEKLGPLHLPMDLLSRITSSIHEIMERAVTKETGLEHVHLFIHVPAGYSTQVGSWGFFRIERMDAEGAHASHSHAVDLYLYPE